VSPPRENDSTCRARRKPANSPASPCASPSSRSEVPRKLPTEVIEQLANLDTDSPGLEERAGAIMRRWEELDRVKATPRTSLSTPLEKRAASALGRLKTTIATLAEVREQRAVLEGLERRASVERVEVEAHCQALRTAIGEMQAELARVRGALGEE